MVCMTFDIEYFGIGNSTNELTELYHNFTGLQITNDTSKRGQNER